MGTVSALNLELLLLLLVQDGSLKLLSDKLCELT